MVLWCSYLGFCYSLNCKRFVSQWSDVIFDPVRFILKTFSSVLWQAIKSSFLSWSSEKHIKIIWISSASCFPLYLLNPTDSNLFCKSIWGAGMSCCGKKRSHFQLKYKKLAIRGYSLLKACGNSPRFYFLIKWAELNILNGIGYGLQHYFAQEFGRGPQNIMPFPRLSCLLIQYSIIPQCVLVFLRQNEKWGSPWSMYLT